MVNLSKHKAILSIGKGIVWYVTAKDFSTTRVFHLFFFCFQKQSIQAQVASESAHELDEIQRAIAAESQSSRGSASIGNGGASVIGGAASPV